MREALLGVVLTAILFAVGLTYVGFRRAREPKNA